MKYSCSLALENVVVLFVLFCGCEAPWSSSKLDPKKSQERLTTELSPHCGNLNGYSSLILQTLLQHAYFIDRFYPATSQGSPDGDTIDLLLQFLSPVCGEWSSGFTREKFLSTAQSNQAKFAGTETMTILQKENLWPFTTDILMVPQDSHYYVKYILMAKDKKQMAEYSRVVKLIGDEFRAYLAAGPAGQTTLDSDINHQNIVNAWILLLVRFMSDEVNDCQWCPWIVGTAVVGVLYGFAAYKWSWIPFRPDLTPIPIPSPVPNSTTLLTDTPPTLSFTIITILALIAIAIGIFYYYYFYYRKREGSKSTSSASSTSSNSKTRSRSSDNKKEKTNRKDKHKEDGSFLSNCPFLSNFASWTRQSEHKKKAKKGGKHSKVSSIVPSQSSAVSNSSAVFNSSAISSSPITRQHDKKKKKVRKGGKDSKVSSINNSNSSIVSSSPITRRQSPDKKKSPKGGKNQKK